MALKVTVYSTPSKLFQRLFQLLCQGGVRRHSCATFWGMCSLSVAFLSTVGCNPRAFQSQGVATAPASQSASGEQGVTVAEARPVMPGPFRVAYLAEQIDRYYKGTNPGPVGVTTFVNLDDLYNTSTFGRMYSEQLMNELTMRGYDVVEMRHTDALQFLASAGEFSLSRDSSLVRRSRDLGAVVVGTYVVSPVKVYVNARLLNPSTSMVLSAGSVELPKSGEIARLVRGTGMPATLERIPVRHLGFGTFPATGFGGSNSERWDAEESWSESDFARAGAGVAPRIPVLQPQPRPSRISPKSSAQRLLGPPKVEKSEVEPESHPSNAGDAEKNGA